MTRGRRTTRVVGPRRASRQRDGAEPLRDALHRARINAGLTQEQLARKVDVGQRLISDLERGKVDARFSTVQNVARALDLEVMLLPRHLISVVDGLERGARGASDPLYALQDEDGDDAPDADGSKEPQ